MKSFFNRLKKIQIPFNRRDLHIYGGLFLMGIGLWLAASWLSLTVIGFLLFCCGIFARKLV